MTLPSSLLPLPYWTDAKASDLFQNSTKQKPHGVFLRRSRPMFTALTGPIEEKKPNMCDALVEKLRFPTYTVLDACRALTCASGD